jgi:GT2 family glycosyltransferase
MPANADIKAIRRTNLPDARFSILIPSWNNLEYLKICVNSIRRNSTYSHQIIIHVNEGKDGTLEWINEQKDIDYTYSTENVGICYALNNCRKLMSTELLMYMNDDMYVCPRWDEALIAEIEKIGHNRFFISATCIEPFSRNKCMISSDYGSTASDFNEQKLLKEYDTFVFDDWQGATWPPNIVHKDIWDLVGGYSEEFSPGMYSDPDFSMKLWKAGIRYFKGVTKSRVYHFGSKSVNRVKKNPGYYTFLLKWGITPSTLTTHYLKRGEKFNGILPEPSVPFTVRVKNLVKKTIAIFKTQAVAPEA